MKAFRLPAAFALTFSLALPLPVSAELTPQDIAEAARIIREIQELTTTIQAVSPGAELRVTEPRRDTKGKYLSPYRADGSLTEWAQKGMGSAVGGAIGSAAGDRLGKLASKELAAKVPGGAMIGGLFGKKAKKTLQETAAVKAIGGWDFIRETSDLSFDNTMALAVYLHANYAGTDPDFAKALSATMGVYPRLRGAYEPAVKRAYGREVVLKAQEAQRNGTVPQLPQLAQSAGGQGNGGGQGGVGGLVNALTSAAGGSTEEQAVQGAFLHSTIEANSMQSSGGIGGSAADMAALDAEPAPDLPPIEIDARRHFKTKAKQLRRSQRVVVPGFRVAFIIRDSVTASVAAGYQLGGTHTSGASSKTAVELAGVDHATLQGIADQLHADFLADLADSGREVVSMDELQSATKWSELETTPASMNQPYVKEAKWLQDRILTVYTPSDLPLWWTNGEQMGDKSPFFLKNWKVLTHISYELDAVVLVPTYLLSFAELESSGNKRGLFAGYGSGRASTGAKPNMVILENETKLFVLHAKNTVGGDMGQIHAHKRIVVGDFGAEMVTLDERDNNNASRAALLGLAGATGSQGVFAAAGPSRSEQTLAVRTNPEWFTAFSLSALRGVNDVFIDAVKANAP